jgi:hypothetical protein
MKKLNVYIYKEDNCDLIKQLKYSELILALNIIIDNNIINQEKWNLICSNDFPPEDCIYDKENKTFLSLNEFNIKTKKQFINIIKHV